jgi:cell division septation protein DedD
MRDDRGDSEDVREFRIEGLTLVVALAVLVVLLGGAFWVGRLVERRNHPELTAGQGLPEDPLANVAQTDSPADVDATADFFDTAEGEDKELEPGREVRRGLGQTAQQPEQSTSEPGAAAGGSGSFFVQIWAGRDRQAAELLVEKLRTEGYAVKIFSDRVEGDTLFKVRVGGFETEAEARRKSGELEQRGYRGAWVTTVE